MAANMLEEDESVTALPTSYAGFGKLIWDDDKCVDSMPNIYDIDYLCGARYRGELKGQYRHGVGAITYNENEKPIIGFWKYDKMNYNGVEHPTKPLEPIAVT